MNIKKNSKNNTYYFSISLGINPVDGKRRQTMRHGFKTKKEAEHSYIQLRRKYFNNTLENNMNKISFEELVTIYLEERKEQIKITTYKGEQTKINYHILPYFKNALIDKLERLDIKEFQTHLKSKELSNNTINKIMLTLKKLFDCAIEHQAMNTNPCVFIPSLKVKKTEMEFWTLDDFKEFISYVKEHGTELEYLFYTVAYMTGARLSEVLALRWQDINFNSCTWRVKYSFHLDKEKGFYLDTPKTQASERSITFNKSTFELIKNFREQNHSEFVFTSHKENIPPRTRLLKAFYKYIEQSGVKKIRFHDLRHSHVALLIDMEEYDFVIKERMGHASIRITYDIYGHLFPTKQHELANRLGNLL